MILIVDDNSAICRPIQLLLTIAGIPAQCVQNGIDAIRFAMTNHPKVILLDQTMPGMSGVETLRRIRSNPETSTTPVFFFTGEDDSAVRSEAESLKIDGWFAKGRLDWNTMLRSMSLAHAR